MKLGIIMGGVGIVVAGAGAGVATSLIIKHNEKDNKKDVVKEYIYKKATLDDISFRKATEADTKKMNIEMTIYHKDGSKLNNVLDVESVIMEGNSLTNITKEKLASTLTRLGVNKDTISKVTDNIVNDYNSGEDTSKLPTDFITLHKEDDIVLGGYIINDGNTEAYGYDRIDDFADSVYHTMRPFIQNEKVGKMSKTLFDKLNLMLHKVNLAIDGDVNLIEDSNPNAKEKIVFDMSSFKLVTI